MWEPGAPGWSWWGRCGLEGAGLASHWRSLRQRATLFLTFSSPGRTGCSPGPQQVPGRLRPQSELCSPGLELSEDPWGK